MTTPTDTQIAQTLAGYRTGISSRFRFERRTKTYDLIDDISEGVVMGSGQIQLDNTRPIARTLSLDLRPSLLPADFDSEIDIIAAFSEVLVAGTWQRFPLGLFQIDSLRDVRTPNQTVWTITGADLMTLLWEQDTTDTYTVPAGTRYVDAIAAVIAPFGLRLDLPAIGYTTPVAFTWPVGAKWGDIANALAQGMGAFPLWADAEGYITTRQLVMPIDEIPDTVYSTANEPLMLRPSLIRSRDRSRYPNRTVIKVSDPLRTAQAIAYTNDDDDSPIAISKRGTSSQEISGDRMANTTVMDLVGHYSLCDSSCRAQQAQLITHPDPRRTSRETYTLTVEDIEGESKWRVISWRLPLANGATMQHSVGRATEIDMTRTVL